MICRRRAVSSAPAWIDLVHVYAQPVIALTISFVVAGLFWFSHHRRLAVAPEAGRGVVFLNLFFLLSIIILPVTNGLYGSYRLDGVVAVIYGLHLTLIASLNALLWILALRGRHDPQLLVTALFPVFVFVLGTAVAFVAPRQRSSSGAWRFWCAAGGLGWRRVGSGFDTFASATVTDTAWPGCEKISPASGQSSHAHLPLPFARPGAASTAAFMSANMVPEFWPAVARSSNVRVFSGSASFLCSSSAAVDQFRNLRLAPREVRIATPRRRSSSVWCRAPEMPAAWNIMGSSTPAACLAETAAPCLRRQPPRRSLHLPDRLL